MCDFSGSVAGIYYGTNDYISNPTIPFAPGYTPSKAKTGHSGAFPGEPAIDYKAFVVPVLTAGTAQAAQYGVLGPDPSGSADNSETTFGPPGGRNALRGAFQKRADMSLVKLTKLTDRFELRYSFDVFNITNTPSFDTPNNNVEFNPHFDGNYVTVPRGQLGIVQHTIGSPRLYLCRCAWGSNKTFRDRMSREHRLRLTTLPLLLGASTGASYRPVT